MLHLVLQKGNTIITLNTFLWGKKEKKKKEKQECKQHAFPDNNVRALLPNAFLKVF